MIAHGIMHTTIEVEEDGECDNHECAVLNNENKHVHHH